MNKREKVIQALENCTQNVKCRDCPWEPCDSFDYTHSEYPDGLIKDALELLKAQEPKDPVYTEFYDIDGKNLSHWDCGTCGAFLYDAAWFGSTLKDNRPKYCSRCGQAVKWK